MQVPKDRHRSWEVRAGTGASARCFPRPTPASSPKLRGAPAKSRDAVTMENALRRGSGLGRGRPGPSVNLPPACAPGRCVLLPPLSPLPSATASAVTLPWWELAAPRDALRQEIEVLRVIAGRLEELNAWKLINPPKICVPGPGRPKRRLAPSRNRTIARHGVSHGRAHHRGARSRLAPGKLSRPARAASWQAPRAGAPTPAAQGAARSLADGRTRFAGAGTGLPSGRHAASPARAPGDPAPGRTQPGAGPGSKEECPS